MPERYICFMPLRAFFLLISGLTDRCESAASLISHIVVCFSSFVERFLMPLYDACSAHYAADGHHYRLLLLPAMRAHDAIFFFIIIYIVIERKKQRHKLLLFTYYCIVGRVCIEKKKNQTKPNRPKPNPTKPFSLASFRSEYYYYNCFYIVIT